LVKKWQRDNELELDLDIGKLVDLLGNALIITK
jgi:hypothetical protein